MEIDNEPLIFGLSFIVLYSICGFDNVTLYSRILGFLIGGIFIFLLVAIGTMGGGDMKLMFVIGFFVGLRLTLFTLYISFVCGAIIGIIYMIKNKRKLKESIPFGPSIALGTILSICFF